MISLPPGLQVVGRPRGKFLALWQAGNGGFRLAARASYDTWPGLTGHHRGTVCETAVRLPVLICGVLSIGAMAWLGLRLGGPGMGLAAGVLTAFHPRHLRYSVEARDYGMLLLALPPLFPALHSSISYCRRRPRLRRCPERRFLRHCGRRRMPGRKSMKSSSGESLASRARTHWTPDRLQRLMAGKRLPLHPVTHAAFLHATGLMDDDASVTSGQVKKYLQINHMISLIAPPFRALAKAMPGRTLTLLDAGCGNSYLSLAFAFLAREANAGRMPQIPDWKDTRFDLHVIGVDTNQDVIRQSRERAEGLGLGDAMSFQSVPLQEAVLPERLHAVMALHACDTATDDALALGIRRQADILAVAPCCQAELAQHFKALGARTGTAHPLEVILHSPNLRRDTAATFTDALRLALVRALGYEATATEFIPSAHTPKNRLILAERRGRYNKAGLASFLALKEASGDAELALERGVKDVLAERFPG